jgi:hypothetical protein
LPVPNPFKSLNLQHVDRNILLKSKKIIFVAGCCVICQQSHSWNAEAGGARVGGLELHTEIEK